MIRLIICFAILTFQTYAIILPIFSFSKESGSIYGLFVQQKLIEDTEAQFLFFSQSKGISSYLNATNIPLLNEKANIRFNYSNTGEIYNKNNLYYDNFNTNLTIEKKLSSTWDALFGLDYIYYKENTEKNNHTDTFAPLSTVGLIIGAQIDKRNREYNTNSGYFNEIKLNLYDRYQILSNDVRYFIPSDYGVIATRLYTTQTFTNQNHIQFLASVGNYYYLRGYNANEIFDRHLSFGQLELRTPILSWLVLAPFIEAGVIGSSISNITNQLFSYGFGIYIFIGNGAFRLDFGYAEDNNEFKFGFNHVF